MGQKTVIILIVCCLLSGVFCSCSNNKKAPAQPGGFTLFPNKNLESARGVAGRYLDSLRDRDYRRASEYFSPVYFKTISKEKFQEHLAATAKQLGAVQSYREMSHTGKKENKKDIREYYVLQYEVTYQRARSIETFTLHPTPTSGVYEITKWDMDCAQMGQ